MEKRFGNKKTCIIRNAIAVALFLVIISRLFLYLDFGTVDLVLMAVSGVGIINFIWMLCYLLTYGSKIMIVQCEKTKVTWLLAGVYVIIMGIIVACRYKAEMFVEYKLYEAMIMTMALVAYPMLTSILLVFRNRFGKTKGMNSQIIFMIGVLSVCNFTLLGCLDFINCLIVGVSYGYATGKAVFKIMDKPKKMAEFIIVVAGISISVSMILIVGGYNGPEIFTYEMWKYATDYYGPFIGYTYNIFVARNIIYFLAVILFCVVTHKLLSQGNVKNRCFYISYKTAYTYLVVKYIIVLCFSVAVGGMNNYWTEAYVFVDLIMMAIIVFSSYDEYKMWEKQEEIESKKLVEIADVFGKRAGDTFTLLEVYEYDGLVSLRDDKTSKVEVFACAPGYKYNGKNYDMYLPLDRRDEILILECEELENIDIEDEYVEESEYEEMMKNEVTSDEENGGVDEEDEDEENGAFKLYAINGELCAEVYEKYKQALMNRAADEFWDVDGTGEM